MVVGGFADEAQYTVEIVNLSNDGKVCDPVPNYSGAKYGAVGTFINGKALLCGSETASNTCSSYNHEVRPSYLIK